MARQAGRATGGRRYLSYADLEDPAKDAVKAARALEKDLDGLEALARLRPEVWTEEVLAAVIRCRNELDATIEQALLHGVLVLGMTRRTAARAAGISTGAVDRWVATAKEEGGEYYGEEAGDDKGSDDDNS